MCQHCSGKHVKIAINYPLVETLHNWAHSLWDPDRTPLVHVAMSLCLWTLVVALYCFAFFMSFNSIGKASTKCFNGVPNDLLALKGAAYVACITSIVSEVSL